MKHPPTPLPSAIVHGTPIVNWLPAFRNVLIAATLICTVLMLTILWLNHGTYTYTLDDPYIHLALARNIAQGQYGINLSEPSAPSSSIVWPLLLAPFAATPFGDVVPLVYNLGAAIVVLALLCQLIGRVYAPLPQPRQRFATVATVLALSVIINLFGLVFTGMEHTLQIALSLTMLLGLLRVSEGERVPWWLAVALIAAPLVRYECLALTGAALGYLLWRRKIGSVLLIGGVLALLIGGFSLFLNGQGLGFLPSSIIAKSAGADRTLGSIAGSRLMTVLTNPQGWILVFGAAALATTGDRALRPVGVCIATAALAHLVLGRIGGYPRYENYLVALVLVTLLLSDRVPIAQFVAGARQRVLLLLALVVPLLLGGTSVLIQIGTPLGSNNIYEQQYQMSRFVADYWQAPIAVNDLGLVARRGNQYTLDLWGLGSREALALRQSATPDAEWLAALTDQRNVKLVMIYPDLFSSVPATWRVLGDLHLSRPSATVAGDFVRFYATDAAAADRALPLLDAFAQQLPNGVRFVVAR